MFLPLATFLIVGIFLSMIDLQAHRLPNRLVLFLSGVLILEVLFIENGNYLLNCLKIAFYYCGLFVTLFVFTKQKIGFGDVKFSIPCGLVIGFYAYSEWLINLWLMFALSGIVSLILLRLNQISLNQRIAFGPFMAVATLITGLNSLT